MDRPRLDDAPRALLVWGVAVGAYVVAVLNRSSLGVATLEAGDRFGIGASTLAALAVAQLTVYAVLQVPVGLLLDRFGARRLVAAGALVMAAGQVLLAVTTQVPVAVAGRMLVGAGDALTFVSVVRLVPAWFSVRRTPLMTQLTGSVGQLGQVLSAIPLVALLHGHGWTPSFLSVGAVGVVAAVATMVVVRDVPAGTRPEAASATAAALLASPAGRREPGALRHVLREPAVRLGFWMHFVGQFSTHVITLMWGFAFFVEGQGRSPAQASVLLTLTVVAAVVAGPVLGATSGRWPHRRVRTSVGVAALTGLAWAAVLVPAVPVPFPVLMAFAGVVGIGGPTSLLAFDVARDAVPARWLGTAIGFVNTGGFVAALSTVWLVGVVLDSAGGGVRDLDGYRTALAVVALPLSWGVGGVLLNARRARSAGGRQGSRSA